MKVLVKIIFSAVDVFCIYIYCVYFINIIYYSDNFSCALVLKESKATRPAAANPDIFQLLGLLQDFDVNWQPLMKYNIYSYLYGITNKSH